MAKCSILEYKLRKFAGKYDQILNKHIELVLFDFTHWKEESAKNDLIQDLKKMVSLDYISPIDIADLVSQIGIKVDSKVLWTLLLRNSLSVHQIKGSVIEGYLLPLLIAKAKLPRVVMIKNIDGDNNFSMRNIRNHVSMLGSSNVNMERWKTDSSDPESKMNAQQKLLFKIADHLFSRNQTLMGLLQMKIHDKVIDGKEYQLIKRNSLINWFSKIGVSFNHHDQMNFKDLIRPIIQDFVDVKVVLKIMEDLGITEDIPPATKHLDYNKLEGPAIRIFNRIIRYMKTNEIIDVIEFLHKENCELIDVVSKTKQDKIETIQAAKLRDVLRSKDIIQYGEDLDDNFIEFLELSPEFNKIIMIRKLKKAIKDIKDWKYFQYYGYDKREGESEPPDEDLQMKRSINKSPTKYYSQQNLRETMSELKELSKDRDLSQDVKRKIQKAIEEWKLNKLTTERGQKEAQSTSPTVRNLYTS